MTRIQWPPETLSAKLVRDERGKKNLLQTALSSFCVTSDQFIGSFFCWVASVYEALCYSLDWIPSLCIPVLTDFTGVISGWYRCKMRSRVSVYMVKYVWFLSKLQDSACMQNIGRYFLNVQGEKEEVRWWALQNITLWAGQRLMC